MRINSKLPVLALSFIVLVSACDWFESSSEADTEWATDTEDCPELQEAADAGIHAPWDRLTRSFIDGDKVAYHCIEKHQDVLDDYLKTLAKTDPKKLEEKEQLALWINAYNAFTVKLILRKYPDLDSIRDIPDRWDLRDWEVGGKKVSLNDIEHEILRKEFEEPRIHAAINCASYSCPNILPEAFVGARVEEQLTRAAKAFLQNSSKGATTKTEKGVFGKNRNLYLSKIFDWFGEDFEKGDKTVVDFVLPYLSDEDRAYVEEHKDDLSVEFFDYDWGLNAVKAE